MCCVACCLERWAESLAHRLVLVPSGLGVSWGLTRSTSVSLQIKCVYVYTHTVDGLLLYGARSANTSVVRVCVYVCVLPVCVFVVCGSVCSCVAMCCRSVPKMVCVYVVAEREAQVVRVYTHIVAMSRCTSTMERVYMHKH